VRACLVIAALSWLLPATLPAQEPTRCAAARPEALVLYGPDVAPTPFEIAELRRLPAAEIRAPDHEGAEISYRGVHLWRLLNRAGVTGGELRGARLEQYLVAEAADGYRAVLALPEADSAYQTRAVIVAYEADGKPLGTRSGPLQLIVEADRHHGRWVRQLECIRVARASPAGEAVPR